jgi:S-adenosylmethionine hydrolase
MKGVMLEVCPSATIVDVSHSVEPHSIAEAAFLLRSVYPYFPQGTIHCAVVDPGVGTDRKPIAIQSKQGFLVGPDNGIFTHVALEDELVESDGSLLSGGAVELVSPEFRRPQVSQTFHGRDIFAPAAAHLASGAPLRKLGPALKEIQLLDLPPPKRAANGVQGGVIHVDHFGNVTTNIGGEMIDQHARVAVGEVEIEGLSQSYQEKEIVAIIGSSGLLEVAVRNGNASRRLGLHVGDLVHVSL